MQNSSPRANRLTALFLLLALSVVSYRCSKSDDTPAPNTTTVEGTWKISGLTANPAVVVQGLPLTDLYGGLVLVYPCFAQATLTFVAGGTMTLSIPSGCGVQPALVEQYTGFSSTSKWVVNGSKITITKSDGKTQVTYDYQISGTLLTMTGTDGTTTYVIKLQK